MPCTYCLARTDYTSEHILPKSLGHFSSVSMVLDKKNEAVCGQCNNGFSLLEMEFKEDTFEGFIAQSWCLNGESSVRLRNKKTKIKWRIDDFPDELAQDIFPFKIRDGGTARIQIIPQLSVRESGGAVRCFRTDFLRHKIKNRKKYDDLVRYFNHQSSASAHFRMWSFPCSYGKDMEMYKSLGVPSRFFLGKEMIISSDLTGKNFEVNMNTEVDATTSRLLCKILLNYFIRVTKSTKGLENLCKLVSFDGVRNFILHGEGPRESFIRVAGDSNLIKSSQGTALVHQLCLWSEKSKLFGGISLFGANSYIVNLGVLPRQIPRGIESYSVLDPFTHRVYNRNQELIDSPKKFSLS